MQNGKIIALLFITLLTDCASSSDLQQSASRHDKAGEYYESIGQPVAASEANKQANKDRDAADDLLPLLVELFDIFK